MSRELAKQALALALANAAAGVHEHGGPNMGDQVQFWQRLAGGIAGESWCDDFVYGMLVKAYCQIKGLLVPGSTEFQRKIMLIQATNFSRDTGIPRTGSVRETMRVAKARGTFRDKHFTPEPGDIVFYDLPPVKGYPHHTGFVVTPGKSVEGNTSASGSGSQDNGDGVYVKVRGVDHVVGYWHFS